MNSKTIALLFVIGALLLSCDNSQSNNKDTRELTCYIKSIEKSDDGYILKALHIDFLHDDEAVEAAKKHNEAAIDVDEKGDTLYSVPNDYYIDIPDKTIHSHKIAEGLALDLINYEDISKEEFEWQKAKSISAFLQSEGYKSGSYSERPFEITLSGGLIVKISEIYTP